MSMLAQQPAPLYAAASVPRPAPQRGVLVLMGLALIASFVAMLSMARALRTQIGADPYNLSGLVKDSTYYVAHAAEILLLLAAGLLALRSANPRALARGFLLRLGLFFGAALLMAARGYTWDALFSTKLVDATGPFACLISVALFIGVRRANWAIVDKVLLALAVLLSALTLLGIAGLQTTARWEGVRTLNPFVNALFWPASWVMLKEYPPHSGARHLRFAPIAVYALASVFTQTRLNFVMLFSLLLTAAYVDHRRRARQAAQWAVIFALAAWLLLFAVVFLSDTRAFAKIEAAGEAFSSRLEDDTRTGQLRAFVRSVPPSEWVLGKGSLATWQWGHFDWTGGTDVGYLTLVLYGGLPLLITYLAVHIAPAVAVLGRRRTTGLPLAAAGVVLLWGVRMFSSSYPGLTLDYYPILFCVGACVAREPSPGSPR